MKALTEVVLAALLVGCATIPSAKEIADTDIGHQPHTEAAHRLAEEFISSRLKDPLSAMYRWPELVERSWYRVPLGRTKVAWQYTVWVNAKNSFGGYIGFYPWSFFCRDGSVVAVSTQDGRTPFSICVELADPIPLPAVTAAVSIRTAAPAQTHTPDPVASVAPAHSAYRPNTSLAMLATEFFIRANMDGAKLEHLTSSFEWSPITAQTYTPNGESAVSALAMDVRVRKKKPDGSFTDPWIWTFYFRDGNRICAVKMPPLGTLQVQPEPIDFGALTEAELVAQWPTARAK